MFNLYNFNKISQSEKQGLHPAQLKKKQAEDLARQALPAIVSSGGNLSATQEIKDLVSKIYSLDESVFYSLAKDAEQIKLKQISKKEEKDLSSKKEYTVSDISNVGDFLVELNEEARQVVEEFFPASNISPRFQELKDYAIKNPSIFHQQDPLFSLLSKIEKYYNKESTDSGYREELLSELENEGHKSRIFSIQSFFRGYTPKLLDVFKDNIEYLDLLTEDHEANSHIKQLFLGYLNNFSTYYRNRGKGEGAAKYGTWGSMPMYNKGMPLSANIVTVNNKQVPIMVELLKGFIKFLKNREFPFVVYVLRQYASNIISISHVRIRATYFKQKLEQDIATSGEDMQSRNQGLYLEEANFLAYEVKRHKYYFSDKLEDILAAIVNRRNSIRKVFEKITPFTTGSYSELINALSSDMEVACNNAISYINGIMRHDKVFHTSYDFAELAPSTFSSILNSRRSYYNQSRSESGISNKDAITFKEGLVKLSINIYSTGKTIEKKWQFGADIIKTNKLELKLDDVEILMDFVSDSTEIAKLRQTVKADISSRISSSINGQEYMIARSKKPQARNAELNKQIFGTEKAEMFMFNPVNDENMHVDILKEQLSDEENAEETRNEILRFFLSDLSLLIECISGYSSAIEKTQSNINFIKNIPNFCELYNSIIDACKKSLSDELSICGLSDNALECYASLGSVSLSSKITELERMRGSSGGQALSDLNSKIQLMSNIKRKFNYIFGHLPSEGVSSTSDPGKFQSQTGWSSSSCPYVPSWVSNYLRYLNMSSYANNSNDINALNSIKESLKDILSQISVYQLVDFICVLKQSGTQDQEKRKLSAKNFGEMVNSGIKNQILNKEDLDILKSIFSKTYQDIFVKSIDQENIIDKSASVDYNINNWIKFMARKAYLG